MDKKRGRKFLRESLLQKIKENATRALAAACLIFAAPRQLRRTRPPTDNLPRHGGGANLKNRKGWIENQTADFNWKNS